ncbi:heme-binding protein [Streptomyces tateyamensis]|uniref:Heme-binding protein n=1 Tax=Streptomyces tateyamensis TaxID=565073 RepID=A0A2V4PAD1_9ACTN|nr:heme-binding protein [Streptomyces tateyamensis]PYC88029.1 heme-binding protein [Streptomyces tateyamensis]
MHLDLATAQRLCAAAIGAAAERGLRVSAAVVDAGGNLLAFARMDGAEIAGTVLAPDKAYTAVANRAATHELAIAAAPGGPLCGLHAAAQGRFVIFGGGLPLRGPDGTVIGGLGVSGAADPADDVACAEAAVRSSSCS